MARIRCLAAMMLLLLCPPLAAQENPAVPPAVVRTQASQDNRLTIPITINGKGPWNFVVDTGSQRTVIARDLAERLALPPGRHLTVISMTAKARARTVTVPRLDYGAVTISSIEAPVLEGADLGAPGLLGLDSLHAKRLLLNFRTGRMEISASRRAWRDPNAIIVEARRRKGQLVLLNSVVSGVKVNIILDTGTHVSIGNLALMERLSRKRRLNVSPISLVSVTGETLTGQLAQVRNVRMGPITLSDIPVMFADARPFAELGLTEKPAMLLGIQALRTFDRVAIDFGRGKVDFLLPSGSALDGRRYAEGNGSAG